MSQIKYVDTDGDKSRLLPFRYFGLDNYPSGNDVGRVYIGTGSENIPLAKKAEVDTVSDRLTTLEGYATLAEYGIVDAYTKAEVDNLLDLQDSAYEITYDNSGSNFVSTNVKDVIDEIGSTKLNITDASSLVTGNTQSMSVAMAIVFGN